MLGGGFALGENGKPLLIHQTTNPIHHIGGKPIVFVVVFFCVEPPVLGSPRPIFLDTKAVFEVVLVVEIDGLWEIAMCFRGCVSRMNVCSWHVFFGGCPFS